jgi:hypothetical protein
VAANPRMVINDIDVIADGGTTHVLRGAIIDCPPGSPMETAYGVSNLVSLSAATALSISNGATTVSGGATG